MSNQSTKFLNLDEIDTGPEIILKYGGVDHRLQQITVEQFIKNTKRLQELGTELSLEQEFDVLIDMVNQAFPSLGVDTLRKMELAKLAHILEFARQYNGEQKVNEEAKAEAITENPQTAG